MRSSSRLVVRALIAAIVLVLPSVSAAPAPYNLDAEFDGATNTLTLTWDYDATNWDVDEYRVYLDGSFYDSTTSQSYDDDLDGWTGVKRSYRVSAVVDSEEYALSEQLDVYMLSDGGAILPCPVVGVVTYEQEPWVGIGTYPECLPKATEV